MTEEPQEDSTGAPFHGITDWHAINWQSVNQNVRRLQARIVKATQEKRWGKVKALQRLLTHSFSGKALAVRRVTENQGKNTPGVDKVTREYFTKEDQRCLLAQAKGLPSPTPQANLYTQEKRQEARFRYSCYEMSGYASPLSAGSRPGSRNHSGSKLVRFPATEINSRCDRTVLHGTGKPPHGTMDTRRRHQSLFRRNFPRMALNSHSNGKGHS